MRELGPSTPLPRGQGVRLRLRGLTRNILLDQLGFTWAAGGVLTTVFPEVCLIVADWISSKERLYLGNNRFKR